MRLLLDECVDEGLRHFFPEHECQTVRYAGFAGLKNGRLLQAAEAAGFEVLITIDQNIPDQQNLSGRRLAILILSAPSNRLGHLKKLLPDALTALQSIAPGEVVNGPPPSRRWLGLRLKVAGCG